jgi:RNA polymerase primary sigma factor
MVSEQQAWLDAAGRVPLLTAAEEITLGRFVQAAAGIDQDSTDPDHKRALRRAQRARERLCSANLRLVYTVAKAYRSLVPDHQFLDLLQAGAIGALRAAGTFDPELGYKFSTYAATWIRQKIQVELDKHGRVIRVPSTITPRLRRLPRVRQLLTQRLGREPSVEELATELGMAPAELLLALQRAGPTASLDQCLDGDTTTTLADLQSAPASEQDDEQLEQLREAMAQLPRRQRVLLKAAHLPGGPTLAQAAQIEGVSIAEAQLIVGRGMARLKLLRPGLSRYRQLTLPLPELPICQRAPGPRRRRRCHHQDAHEQLVLFHSRQLRKLIFTSKRSKFRGFSSGSST